MSNIGSIHENGLICRTLTLRGRWGLLLMCNKPFPWEWVLKNNRGRTTLGCVMLRPFISNPCKFIKVWTKMIIMTIHGTHGTWVIGSNFFILWCCRVGITLLLLRRRCRRLVPIWLVFLWGIIPLIPIGASSISLVIIGGLLIYVSSLLILWISFDHV